MTDLTEQMKKGELPEGDYYISNGDEIYPDYYDSAEGFLKTYNYGVRRILAEVPDYVEWQNMVNCACEEHEANKHLIEENAQLKELLKECQGSIATLLAKRITEVNGIKQKELLTKIDEVLK